MIQLQVLGSIGLAGHDGAEVRAVLAQPKRIGLLAYLALAEPVGFHRRDALVAMFWPELGEEEARRALRQALHYLRQHLGPDAIENRGADEVGISRTVFTCDAWEFVARVARGEDARALELYRGDPLAGFHITGAAVEFEEWLNHRRLALRRTALLSARRGSDAGAAAGRLEEAERLARLAVEQLEAEDADVTRLMRLLRESGDATAALATYERYSRHLRENFETEPGAAVRDLASGIRRELGSAGAAAAPPELSSGPAPGGSSPRLRRRPLAVLGVLVVFGAGLAWQLTRRQLPAKPLADPLVAVAVFANRSADTSVERLGTIAAEWTSRSLSRVPRIRVLDLNALYSRGRTETGEPVDPMALARMSKAAYVVGGSYHRLGSDSIRFAADVLDGRSGQIVRSVELRRAVAGDPIRAVDELSNRLASAVQSIVDPRDVLLKAPALTPPRYEAFLEYVQAQEAFFGGGDDQQALAHALRATELDTTSSIAAIFATVVAAGSRCDVVDSITRALEPRLNSIPEFERATLGMSTVRCRRNWTEGIRLQRKRLELYPGSVVVRMTAASTYALANRPAEAIPLYESIDPAQELGYLPPPGLSYFFELKADAYHQLGDFAGERRVADALTSSGANPLLALFLRARSAAGMGDSGVVREVIAALSTVREGTAPLSTLEDTRMTAWVPAPAWVLGQISAELAAHGHQSASVAVAQELAGQQMGEAPAPADLDAMHYNLGRVLLLAGRTLEAESVFAALVSRYPESIRLRGSLGAAAARAGDVRVATATEEWLQSRSNVVPPGLAAYYRAAVVANSGERGRALDLIERLPYRSHPHAFTEFHVDPLLSPLHDEPRFRAFLQPRTRDR